MAPKIFYAQRLPAETITEIKRCAALNGCSEAEMIAHKFPIPTAKTKREEREIEKAGLGMQPLVRAPILKPSASKL